MNIFIYDYSLLTCTAKTSFTPSYSMCQSIKIKKSDNNRKKRNKNKKIAKKSSINLLRMDFDLFKL